LPLPLLCFAAAISASSMSGRTSGMLNFCPVSQSVLIVALNFAFVDKIGGQQEFVGFVQTAFIIGKTGS
jgi:hypothetical protein